MTDHLRVIIGGLARNCATYLPQTLGWFTEARTYFHPDSKIVLITNDSTDNTETLLAEFAASHPDFVKLYTLNGLHAKKPRRTERLAFCRNLFMTHAHATHPDYDYILLADMDDITANFDPRRILACFDPAQTPAEWGALAAAAAPKYYDIWALRSKHHGMEYDCWDAIRHAMQKGTPYNTAVRDHVDRWRFKTMPTDAPIEVESAFGGICLYRMAATRGCIYSGIPTHCTLGATNTLSCLPEVCEHVSFHAQMRERHGARIWIFPPLFVTPLN
jgi:hypothetical protein